NDLLIWPHPRATSRTVRDVDQDDHEEVGHMKEMSRVEQFESIRRDRRDHEMSIRQLALKYKVHRRTVRQALADAVPPPRKVPVRVATDPRQHVSTVRDRLVR